MSERPTRKEKRAVGERSQDVAWQLIEMKLTAFEALELDDEVREAATDARRITDKRARRREVRRLGDVLRNADIDAVERAIAKDTGSRDRASADYQAVERWRSALLDEGDARARFLASFNVDEAELDDAIANAKKERDTGQPKGGQRALFRALTAWTRP